ncbi:MAG: hypothetical protein OEW06_11570 [Gemmatimonadota bacterium]|nr:hypothetical protein [Gemmatimonadota bacterium]MDH4350572.1 hypothetical protein [Gemmatimonadota bacterium]
MTDQDTPDRRMAVPPPAAPWHTLFAPLPADVAALQTLVADMLRRAPPPGAP